MPTFCVLFFVLLGPITTVTISLTKNLTLCGVSITGPYKTHNGAQRRRCVTVSVNQLY